MIMKHSIILTSDWLARVERPGGTNRKAFLALDW